MATLESTVKHTPSKIIDPVCGMKVEPGKGKPVSVHRGHTYWFCAEACRRAFDADPEKYLMPKPVKKKGWLGQWLDRMAKFNEEVFGNSGPRCCH